MEVDFLLIGQGLAGTALSYRLMEAGKTFMVIDTPSVNLSSRIAAGLYNPITGKKMVKTWNADQLFPEIEPFYRNLEVLLGAKFLYPKKIYRPFLSIEEQNEWMGYSGDPIFEDYFEEIHTKSQFEEVNDPFGGIMLKSSGYLDIPVLLDAYTAYLKEKGSYRDEFFDEEELQFLEGGILYKGIKAKGIVYCNGLGAMKSRFFSWLPFAPVKGEILDLDQGFPSDAIINRGVFRITLPSGFHRVGSTYSWHDLDLGPTEGGKKEILEKLHKLILLPEVEILRHRYGIRPATKDRRPILGKHPTQECVYIFNGFGAKGVSLVPYFSKEMLEMLIWGQEPQKDVNIARCKQT